MSNDKRVDCKFVPNNKQVQFKFVPKVPVYRTRSLVLRSCVRNKLFCWSARCHHDWCSRHRRCLLRSKLDCRGLTGVMSASSWLASRQELWELWSSWRQLQRRSHILHLLHFACVREECSYLVCAMTIWICSCWDRIQEKLWPPVFAPRTKALHSTIQRKLNLINLISYWKLCVLRHKQAYKLLIWEIRFSINLTNKILSEDFVLSQSIKRWYMT